ncbi:MAG: ATP-binding protein [Verrucomicrobiota bacterium]
MLEEPTNVELLTAENAELRARLDEAEEALHAIRSGEVDALVVDGESGPRLFTLQGIDAASNRFRGEMLAQVGDSVIATDGDQRVTYFNVAAELQYGVAASDVLGCRLDVVYKQQWSRPEDEMAMNQALHDEGHWRGELVHVKRNGESIFIEVSATRLDLEEGPHAGMLSVIRDITVRKQAEAALRQNAGLFTLLIAQAPTGVYVVDSQFRLQQINALAQPVFKHVNPLIGRDFCEVMNILWGPEVGGQCVDIFRHTLKTGERYISPSFSHRRQDIGVEQAFEWETQRVTLPDGQHGVVCYFNDVTARNALHTSLREQAEKLAQADRRKDEFLAMLAHELRNPLAPMRNAMEILHTPSANAADRIQARVIIKRQIGNMSRMIDDLLDVSRITEGKIELRREAVELQPILTAAAEVAGPEIEANSQILEVNFPKEPVFLDADPTRLEQIFGNLLGNACKYSGPGAHISLSAGITSDQEVVIRVSDDGIGIAPELLPVIFDLFIQSSRTLDRAHGGLGIGLTVVDRLVKLHGGRIEARSEGLGKGTEFIIHLPLLVTPPPESLDVRESPAQDAAVRLLIVDDNKDAAETMAMLQRLRGHQTRVAYTGPDALTVAEEFVPQVVLLDIGLPDMDGFEVARRLRRIPEMENALLIALTGYATASDRQLSSDAGFNEHLAKPADLNVLRDLLLTCTRNADSQKNVTASK